MRTMLLMRLTSDELHLLRQWFNSMEDTNPKYIEDRDRDLYGRILEELKRRSQFASPPATKED